MLAVHDLQEAGGPFYRLIFCKADEEFYGHIPQKEGDLGFVFTVSIPDPLRSQMSSMVNEES